MLEFDEDKQKKKVKDLYGQEEEDLAQLISSRYNIPYANLTSSPVNMDALRLLEETVAREAKVAPFNRNDKKVDIAVLSPESEKTIMAINSISERGYQTTVHVASLNSLEHAWGYYKDLSFATETKGGSLQVSNEEITTLLKTVKTLEDVKKVVNDVIAQKKGYRVSRIFEIMIAGAIATSASDIHIEPEEQYARIRFRLDGVLHDVLTFESETFKLVLSRIKLLSGMKLNVKSNAQDGRLSVSLNNQEIEIRVSALPGSYGESLVLRILNPHTIALSLEVLGMDKKLLGAIKTQIDKPQGLILTTGPTGSGKTTTLYAFLKEVHGSDVKIITIEDPIEYRIPGIVQTQTNTEKGYTFAEGLRSALRQDPDIIMVGEIRDHETAETAITAALTGHSVFSTLHTNNAAGTFPRLIDLGIDSRILPSAINIAMAQRLVRRLCESCKKEAPLSPEEKKLIDETLASLVDRSIAEANTVIKQWVAIGCTDCNGTGYKGRVGVYEAIIIDPEVEKAISEGRSEREIKVVAKSQGFLDMRQDGILKILAGTTSLVELKRVVDITA